MGTGWALVGAPYATPRDTLRAGKPTARKRPWRELSLVLPGVGLVAFVALAVHEPGGGRLSPAWSVALALAGAVGATSAAVGLVASSSRFVLVTAEQSKDGPVSSSSKTGRRERSVM
jgi:hypothetical protein